MPTHSQRGCVIAFLLLALAASSEAQTTRATPIVELRGDGAAMGDAHGKALGEEFRELYTGWFAKGIDADSRDLIFQGVMLFEKQMLPEHLAEIKALAAASKLDQRDVMLTNCLLDLIPMQSCSSIALPASAAPDRVARFARNLDFPSYGIAEKHSVVLIYHAADRFAFATIGWPGMIGALSGMNEHGLTLANMEVTRQAGIPHAMPYTLLYRTLLEHCKTVDEAIEMLKSTPRQTPNNLMLMDAAGNRAVVELTPEAVVVRPGQPDAAVISTNHQRGDDNDTAGRCERYDYLHDTAQGSFGKLDIPALQSMLKHVEQEEMTMQSMIFEPANRVVYLATGNKSAELELVKIDLGSYFSKRK